MLFFRDMTIQDLPVVSQIEVSASHHPWKLKHFEESLNSGHICRVAEYSGSLVAQGVISVVAGEASLLILTVSGQHQRQGYGEAILGDLIEQAEKQADTLFLEVRKSNIKAFNLYLKEGFSEVGHRPNYYPATAHSKSEDAIVMIRDLSLDSYPASLLLPD